MFLFDPPPSLKETSIINHVPSATKKEMLVKWRRGQRFIKYIGVMHFCLLASILQNSKDKILVRCYIFL